MNKKHQKTIKMSETRPYRPSNGSEGCWFMEEYCENCIHEKFLHTQDDNDKKCEILSNSLIYDLNDEEYPEEWIYKDGKPTCTAYSHWDWWGGPWGNDFQEPPPEPIDDPDQLCMNFYDEQVKKMEVNHG